MPRTLPPQYTSHPLACPAAVVASSNDLLNPERWSLFQVCGGLDETDEFGLIFRSSLISPAGNDGVAGSVDFPDDPA